VPYPALNPFIFFSVAGNTSAGTIGFSSSLTTSQKECVAEDIVEGEEEKGLIVAGIGKSCEAIGVDRATL